VIRLPASVVSLAATGAIAIACSSAADTATKPRPAPAPAERTPTYPDVPADMAGELEAVGLEERRPAVVRKACARLARGTTWTVVCPPVVPAGRIMVNFAGGVAGTSRDLSRGYMLSMNSSSIRRPQDKDPGHWTVARGDAAAMREQLSAFGRSRPRSERRTSIAGRQVEVFRMPSFREFPGIYGGHVVLQWRDGTGVMQASVHGSHDDRLVWTLAEVLIRGARVGAAR
jgi:hypothetical protein